MFYLWAITSAWKTPNDNVKNKVSSYGAFNSWDNFEFELERVGSLRLLFPLPDSVLGSPCSFHTRSVKWTSTQDREESCLDWVCFIFASLCARCSPAANGIHILQPPQDACLARLPEAGQQESYEEASKQTPRNEGGSAGQRDTLEPGIF